MTGSSSPGEPISTSDDSDECLKASLIREDLSQEDFKSVIDYNYLKYDSNRHYSFVAKDIKWRNGFLLLFAHILAAYALYQYVIGNVKWQCVLLVYFLGTVSSFGITAGAHRLWCHKAYKAKWPLRLFLAICNTCALEMDIYDWVRDHRVHHKYSETNADPHNSNRGLFFAHIGWLMLHKHPDVKAKGAKIDLSDVIADPIVRFQRKYYIPLVILFWGIIPMYIPVILFGETLWNGFLSCVMFRYVYVLHATFLVNSYAHMYGMRPYDEKIQPRENKVVAYLSYGEGYHNYHHTFPWDYSTSELGSTANFNLTTLLIDLCAKAGLAYDLKKPSPKVIKGRMERSGERNSDLNANIYHTKHSALHVLGDYALGMTANFSSVIIASTMRLLVSGIGSFK